MSSQNLDEKSFENLVRFYEDDLRRILEGVDIDEVLTQGDRGKLSSAGILSYVNATWTVTERARNILGYDFYS